MALPQPERQATPEPRVRDSERWPALASPERLCCPLDAEPRPAEVQPQRPAEGEPPRAQPQPASLPEVRRVARAASQPGAPPPDQKADGSQSLAPVAAQQYSRPGAATARCGAEQERRHPDPVRPREQLAVHRSRRLRAPQEQLRQLAVSGPPSRQAAPGRCSSALQPPSVAPAVVPSVPRPRPVGAPEWPSSRHPAWPPWKDQSLAHRPVPTNRAIRSGDCRRSDTRAPSPPHPLQSRRSASFSRPRLRP